MEYESNYVKNDFNNEYKIQLSDEDLIEGKKFFLIFESKNPDFIVSILDGKEAENFNGRAILDLNNFNGNSAMVMSDTFFNKKMNFFKENSYLNFVVKNADLESKEMDYKIKIQIGEVGNFLMGKSYKTRIDKTIESLKLNLFYKGTEEKNLQKLRFQLSVIRSKQDFSLESELSYNGNTFTMNNVFKKSIGGILSLPDLPVCLAESCNYQLNIALKDVKI